MGSIPLASVPLIAGCALQHVAFDFIGALLCPSNAAYGVGLLCQHCPLQSTPHFPAILAALQPLLDPASDHVPAPPVSPTEVVSPKVQCERNTTHSLHFIFTLNLNFQTYLRFEQIGKYLFLIEGKSAGFHK